MSGARQYAVALLAQLLGAGGALLVATRTWQSARLPRPLPLPDVGVTVSGRSVTSAPTALALVALAGVVAVLALGGRARRLVGVIVMLAGAGIAITTLTHGLQVVSDERLRSIARAAQPGLVLEPDATAPVTVHWIWPVLTVACGVLIAAAGLSTAVLGARWGKMSARYERASGEPAAPDKQIDSVRMWNALDTGADPTDPE